MICVGLDSELCRYLKKEKPKKKGRGRGRQRAKSLRVVGKENKEIRKKGDVN